MQTALVTLVKGSFQRTSSSKYHFSLIFRIETLPPLQVTPVIEISIFRAQNPTMKLRVLAPPPRTADTFTR